MRAAACAIALFPLAACNEAAPDAGASADPPAAPAMIAAENGACPRWETRDAPWHKDEVGQPQPIPASLAGIAAGDRSLVSVRGLRGDPICVPFENTAQVTGFTLSDDRRFVGFGYLSERSFGYRLVDRAAVKAVETGEEPVFSADRATLAALQPRFENSLEPRSVSFWSVGARTIDEAARVRVDLPAAYTDWRVSAVGPGRCTVLSAVRAEAERKVTSRSGDPEAYKRQLEQLPRDFVRLFEAKGGWWLRPAADAAACASRPPAR